MKVNAKEFNVGVYLIGEYGDIAGSADYTRWNKAKWYQKILGFISNRYKNKFIDITPFEFELSDD